MHRDLEISDKILTFCHICDHKFLVDRHGGSCNIFCSDIDIIKHILRRSPKGCVFRFSLQLFQNIRWISVQMKNFGVRQYSYFKKLLKIYNFSKFLRENRLIYVFRAFRTPPLGAVSLDIVQYIY